MAQWLWHPLPNVAEHDKRVCWLTDIGNYDDEHICQVVAEGNVASD